MPLPDCHITSKQGISKAFLKKGISTFAEACLYVKNLPYGRNENKRDPFCVLKDNLGTCSTKHAVLKRLADENSLGIELVTGIYKMKENNTPGVGVVLERYSLPYIPEAHNYFRIGEETFDFTFPNARTAGFIEEILEETVITPEQVDEYKVVLHKNFLTRWLLANNSINLPLGKLWEIREECIAALSQTRTN